MRCSFSNDFRYRCLRKKVCTLRCWAKLRVFSLWERHWAYSKFWFWQYFSLSASVSRIAKYFYSEGLNVVLNVWIFVNCRLFKHLNVLRSPPEGSVLILKVKKMIVLHSFFNFIAWEFWASNRFQFSWQNWWKHLNGQKLPFSTNETDISELAAFKHVICKSISAATYQYIKSNELLDLWAQWQSHSVNQTSHIHPLQWICLTKAAS